MHQTIQTDGIPQPCCAWQGDRPKDLNYTNFFTSKWMNDLRNAFLAGEKPEGCRKCIEADKINADTVRKIGWDHAARYGIDWQDAPKLMWQEVNFSNICNLKCRSCWQYRSSKWIADSVAFGWEPVGYLHSHWSLTEDQAKTIKIVQFLGGEPLLHEEDICRELDKLDRIGRLHEIKLAFTTNCMQLPGKELSRYLSKTQFISWSISIDAWGPLNNYIRSDSDWDHIYDYLKEFEQLCMKSKGQQQMQICATVSIYNIHAMSDFFRESSKYLMPIEGGPWIKTPFHRIFLNSCIDPLFLDIKNIRNDEKNYLINEFKELSAQLPSYSKHCDILIKNLKQKPSLDYDVFRDKFMSYNKKLDDLRGVHLVDWNPRLHNLMS
jgi:uncharacterized Fe-S cluster-containing radical SAM superfamily protein